MKGKKVKEKDDVINDDVIDAEVIIFIYIIYTHYTYFTRVCIHFCANNVDYLYKSMYIWSKQREAHQA